MILNKIQGFQEFMTDLIDKSGYKSGRARLAIIVILHVKEVHPVD